jgi:hypothetical protein
VAAGFGSACCWSGILRNRPQVREKVGVFLSNSGKHRTSVHQQLFIDGRKKPSAFDRQITE